MNRPSLPLLLPPIALLALVAGILDLRLPSSASAQQEQQEEQQQDDASAANAVPETKESIDAAEPEPSTHADSDADANAEADADADDSNARDEVARPYGRGFMNRWRGAGGAMADASDDEWDQLRAFMSENSPNRWSLFERLSDGGVRRGPVMRMILARYRNLVALKEEDSTLYDLRVEQLKMEDAIWGLVRELRTGQLADDKRNEIQSQLREKVAQAVDAWMKERQHRLARLEETLKQEREHIEADLKRRDEMVDSRMQRELDRASDFMGFPSGGRGGGRRGR